MLVLVGVVLLVFLCVFGMLVFLRDLTLGTHLALSGPTLRRGDRVSRLYSDVAQGVGHGHVY